MKNADKLKAFIFDLDGTLIDSMPLWDEIYAAPFEKSGIPVPDGYLLAVNHMSLDECVKYTLESTPLRCDAKALVSAWSGLAAKAYGESVPLKDGASDLLRFLRSEGIRLAIATALPLSLAMPCLKRLGVAEFFDAILSTDDVSRGKDDPAVYFAAAEKLGAIPSECAVVEDSHVGIAVAAKAGFFTIGVFDKSSIKHEDEISAIADVYVRSLVEIEEKLKNPQSRILSRTSHPQ